MVVGYGLEGPEFESWPKQDAFFYSKAVQNRPGAHSAYYLMAMVIISRG